MRAGIATVAGRHWAAILAPLHAAAFAGGETWDALAFAGLLDLPGCFAVLADAAGLALFRVAGDESEVLTIGVRPAARGAGVAGGLLDAGMTECAGRGARLMLLEVADGNAPALALYRRRGFVEVGRRRGYYADGADALLLSGALACNRTLI
ncbi:GNAT family N-acetyltransferase [Lichenicoccus sp.]|uniref:GNAT family N-acetyltransferase n=1 Tax=Lichenicoccus sp. TaxID=2781899 RepID=UPI003D1034CB